MKQILCTKMHCLGNDFVILNGLSKTIKIWPAFIKKLAHRQCGIGCDQVLIIEPPQVLKSDFFYRIFNQDGSEAEQCGNGAMSLAAEVWDKKICQGTTFSAQCLAGPVRLEVLKDHFVNLTLPVFNPHIEVIHLNAETKLISINLGNPHWIWILPDIFHHSIPERVAKIKSHPNLKENDVNLSLISIVNNHHIKCRVFERGAGETLACGSGACASVLAGQYLGLLKSEVTVAFKLGQLNIKYDPAYGIKVRGQVFKTFEGIYHYALESLI